MSVAVYLNKYALVVEYVIIKVLQVHRVQEYVAHHTKNETLVVNVKIQQEDLMVQPATKTRIVLQDFAKTQMQLEMQLAYVDQLDGNAILQRGTGQGVRRICLIVAHLPTNAVHVLMTALMEAVWAVKYVVHGETEAETYALDS